jgi:hypothetical protein
MAPTNNHRKLYTVCIQSLCTKKRCGFGKYVPLPIPFRWGKIFADIIQSLGGKYKVGNKERRSGEKSTKKDKGKFEGEKVKFIHSGKKCTRRGK